MKRTVLGAAAAAAVLLGLVPLAAGAQGAHALQSPFAAQVRALQRAGRASGAACARPTQPAHEVTGVRFYSDARGSVIDRAKLAENNAHLAPLRDYLDAVTKMSDAAVLGDRGAATCALVWLDAWARANALDGPVNHQGEYEREWTAGGLALAYLKLRDTGYLAAQPVERTHVEQWFVELAHAIVPYYEGPQHAQDLNNHAYWCGLSVSAIGIAANDRMLFDWGVAQYRIGVGMIAPDGTLPMEMARGIRALHYHLFAVMPLVLLAEMGEANGLDLYAASDGALHRLAKLSLHGAVDPSFFVHSTGLQQDTAHQLRIDEIAWIDAYVARFGPNPDASAILARYRPIFYARFGGDVTQLYTASP